MFFSGIVCDHSAARRRSRSSNPVALFYCACDWFQYLGSEHGSMRRCWDRHNQVLVGGPGFEPGASRSRTVERLVQKLARRSDQFETSAPAPGRVQIRANLQTDCCRNCYPTGSFLRAIRRGVFLERDGRPETGRVAWCWWPRSPLESLNGVLSVWAHINELARLRRLRRDDQKQLLHGLLHHCRSDVSNPSSSLPARPVAGGYEGLEVSDSRICKRKT